MGGKLNLHKLIINHAWGQGGCSLPRPKGLQAGRLTIRPSLVDEKFPVWSPNTDVCGDGIQAVSTYSPPPTTHIKPDSHCGYGCGVEHTEG